MVLFDYNTMYKKYFTVYESCRRQYDFAKIKESEFRKIVREATIETLKDNADENLFKITLRNNLNFLLRQLTIKKIEENQYYYLNNYFNDNFEELSKVRNSDEFLKVLASVIKYLNTYSVKISEETASKLILNNANVSYLIRLCRTYNRRLRLTSLFKDYNINILLFWYEILNDDLEKKEDIGGMKSTRDNKNSEETFKKEAENISEDLNKYSKENNELNIENNSLINDRLPMTCTFKKSRKKKTNIAALINRSVYKIFSDYSVTEINTAYSLLNDNNKEILSRLYDVNLEPVVSASTGLTGQDRAAIKRVLINMLTILKRNKGEQPTRNNLYYRFENYTKEEISAVIKDLSFDDQSIIQIRYNFDGNYKSGSISKNVQNKLRVILNSKIPRNLKRLRFNRLIDFLYLHYYNAYTVDKIVEVLNFLGVDFQDNLYQSLDFLNDLPVVKNEVMLKKCLAIFDMHIKRIDKRDTLIHEMKVIFGNSSDKLIKVLSMKLGLLDGKFYSDIEISIILEISLQEVEGYKEMLRELVKELQISNNHLKRSLK